VNGLPARSAPTRDAPIDLPSALERSYAQTARLVAGLAPARLGAPSLRLDSDVRATLNQLLRATWAFTLVNQGREPDGATGDLVGDDPALAIAAAAKENVASWRRPGAFEGERVYSWGAIPAELAAVLNLEEVLVHNWDIAKAMGIEPAPDDDIAQLVYERVLSLPLEIARRAGAFGPVIATPISESATDRLLGLRGRVR
jgi:uncharacterized protein (TIGR03086 family)